MQISDQQFSIISSYEVQQICQPFFDATCINYFCYARFYKSGHTISLVSNPEWQKYYYRENLNKENNFGISLGQKLWITNSEQSKALISSRDLFDIDNRYEITTDCGDYIELCGFGGRQNDQSVLNIYFNHFETLLKFKFYFLEKAQHLLRNATHPKNWIYARTSINNLKSDIILPENMKNLKRYYLGSDYLTHREFECISHAIAGKNSVETAQILNISEKTVRYYMDAIRIKFNVSTKSELIDKLIKQGVMRLYF